MNQGFELILPTAQFDPFPHIHILAFGLPFNWSTSLLRSQEDVRQYDLGKRLFAITANQENIETILSPCTQLSNSRICHPSELTTLIVLPAEPLAQSKISVRRGSDADGVIVGPRQAFYVSTGDCIVGVMIDTKSLKTVAFHASRESLIPKQWLEPEEHDEEPRKPSVIDQAHSALQAEGPIKVFLGCGIGALNFDHPLDHPKFGDQNKRLIRLVSSRYGQDCLVEDRMKDGCLSLQTIARKQCLELDIPDRNIASDGIDTFADGDHNGKPIWWSKRRGDIHNRNGIFVFRKF